MDTSTMKWELRRTIRARRSARTAAQRQQIAAVLARTVPAIPQVRQASCVAVYASLPDEPGTADLRRALRALRVHILLPVVRDGDEPILDWAPDADDLRTTGSLGLPEPTGGRLGPEAITEADVLLVPAMAVDTDGVRLGRGRGYYDTALELLARRRGQPTSGPAPAASARVFALVHDDELLDAQVSPVPAQPHDRRVDAAITPTRTVFFGPA